MADIPQKRLQHFLFWGSFILVFIVFRFAVWINNHHKIQKAEERISHHFKEFRTYKKDFFLPSIKVAAPNGDVIDLKNNHRTYTILNIWATWCTPCIKELPSLKKLNELLSYDSGWRIIAVSIDTKENLEKLATFTTRYKVEDIANYHDYNLELQKNINIKKLPMTFIINKSGKVLYKIHGDALWQDKEIIDFLNLVKKVY